MENVYVIYDIDASMKEVYRGALYLCLLYIEQHYGKCGKFMLFPSVI